MPAVLCSTRGIEEVPMRSVLACAVVAALLSIGAPMARAEKVDVALVLAADVSRSIDDDEFKLQRQGYAAAITNPRVLHAIAAGQGGAIAICFVEWSGPEEQQVIADWTVIRDGESAAAFAATLLAAPRAFVGRTALSAALDFSRAYLAKVGAAAERRIIDVSGDGTNNSGRSVRDARDEAVAAGVTVNGLAIINEHPNPGYFAHTQPPEGLPEYYRQNVVGGAGAFLMVVQDFNSFGEAITNKLINEIAGSAAPTRAADLAR
jgi:hypothetical protein